MPLYAPGSRQGGVGRSQAVRWDIMSYLIRTWHLVQRATVGALGPAHLVEHQRQKQTTSTVPDTSSIPHPFHGSKAICDLLDPPFFGPPHPQNTFWVGSTESQHKQSLQTSSWPTSPAALNCDQSVPESSRRKNQRNSYPVTHFPREAQDLPPLQGKYDSRRITFKHKGDHRVGGNDNEVVC